MAEFGMLPRSAGAVQPEFFDAPAEGLIADTKLFGHFAAIPFVFFERFANAIRFGPLGFARN